MPRKIFSSAAMKKILIIKSLLISVYYVCDIWFFYTFSMKGLISFSWYF